MTEETWVNVFGEHLGDHQQRKEKGEGKPGAPAGKGPLVGEDGLARPPWALRTEGLRKFYDLHWGTPQTTDEELFATLSLLILQAGLFWGATVGRAEQLAEHFSGFSPDAVAGYGSQQVRALLNNRQVIRNRKKIESVIVNARATVALRRDGGLARLVWAHQPDRTPTPKTVEEIPAETEQSAALADALRRAGFTFVGPRLAWGLMQVAGVVDTNLVGAHRRGSSGLWNEDGTVRQRVFSDPR